PCYDGTHEHEYYTAVADSGHAPICQILWDPANHTAQAPWFGYLHWEPAASGEDCHGTYGSSITGLGFYQASLASQGDPFPPGYNGALFFVDYARGCIWAILPGASGAPDPANAVAFGGSSSATENFWPVDVVQGPDGLYIPNIGDDSITRIRYFSNNVPPVAALTADRTYGATPLDVQFDASGSSDPEGGDLHYAWDLNGDGQFDDGSDQPTASATYSSSSNVTAKVRVTDGGGASDTAALAVHPGDLGPPAPVIDSPSADLQYAVGDTIAYSGHATDPDTGQAVQLDWEFFVRHCPSDCHSHPLGSDPNSSGGELVAPPHEDPSHLELILTATDARGLSATTVRDIYPHRVTVNLESDPAGVPLTLQGTSDAAPWSTTMPAGNRADVVAPETASLGGVTYSFTGWSDGGERVHSVSPRDDLILIAHYSPPPPPPPPPPTTVSILLRSKPRGITLRLGPLSRATPFSDDLAAGIRRMLYAPRRVRRGGRIWVFSRWSNNGPRKQWITVRADRAYTAIYRLRRR
ncbi:MAG TPA: PKD domain-containing protein, partial [Solirubrobacterales bacterium]